jgi:hypothetical protein
MAREIRRYAKKAFEIEETVEGGKRRLRFTAKRGANDRG